MRVLRLEEESWKEKFNVRGGEIKKIYAASTLFL
tara:strand:- start:75 stop:176 length:102 start_codon:yes stop_codon:yes gene_type:complete